MMRLLSYFLLFFNLIILFCSGCSQSNSSISGYIEGEYTYVSSGISGTLFTQYVNRGQTIKKNDLLFSLDPEPEQSEVLAKKSQILDLAAQVKFAQLQLERKKQLLYKNNISKADLDQAQTDFSSKLQQLATSRAQLLEAEWALQQKTQKSLVSGKVFDTFYRIGEKVPANYPVVAILAPENIRALFYIPEKILHKISIGEKVTLSCDSCNGKTTAIVSYISPEAEYTPPVIYSKDTRDKLVYLVRANIEKSEAEKFHPGQPITVYLPA